MGFTTQAGGYPQTATAPDVINLGLGQPSPALLPIDLIAAAAARRLRPETDPLLLQYGAMRGYETFREALAAFLSSEYRAPVNAEELMITGGISSALSLVADMFGGAGTTVVTGDPTYFLAKGVFETAGMRVVGIPVDDSGLRVDLLEARIVSGDIAPKVVYCMPSFHNPCGVRMAAERCERLVALAEARDFVVIADEPYIMLHFDEAPPPSLMAFDRGRGRVLSLGSFSKILGPGLRLGWVHAAPVLLERLCQHGALRSGGGLNPVVSAIVHGTLEDGSLAAHVEHLRHELHARCDALVDALRTELPSCTFEAPGGGYFVWLDLGPGTRTTALAEAAAAHAVGFTPGPRCAVSGDLERYARLCFAFYTPDELRLGVRRFAAAQAQNR